MANQRLIAKWLFCILKMLLAIGFLQAQEHKLCKREVNSRLTDVELDFYTGLFQKLSNHKVSEEIAECELTGLADILQLNLAETRSMRTAVRRFNFMITKLTEVEEMNMSSGEGKITEKNQSQIRLLVQKRDLAVRKITLSFLKSLRPPTILQLRKYIESYRGLVNTTNTKFVNDGTKTLYTSDWNSWQECIGMAGNDCALVPGGPYMISRSIIPADGVTMRGAGISPGSVNLVRAKGFTQPLIHVKPSLGVKIINLTVNGNRQSFANDQNGCGEAENRTCGPSTSYGCTRPNLPIFEIDVQGQAIIDQVHFVNAPGASLILRSGSLVNSRVQEARSTGVFFYGGQIMLSSFIDNGTAGVNLTGNDPKLLHTCMFYRNRHEMPDGAGGGQIYIDFHASHAVVYDNLVDGAGWQTGENLIKGCEPPLRTQSVWGIEVEPYSFANALYANEIRNHTAAGIIANSVSSLKISGYNRVNCLQANCGQRYIHHNIGNTPPFMIPANGIDIIGNWYSIPSSGIILDSILSRSNSGLAVNVADATTGDGWKGKHCLLPSYSTSQNFKFGIVPLSTKSCP